MNNSETVPVSLLQGLRHFLIRTGILAAVLMLIKFFSDSVSLMSVFFVIIIWGLLLAGEGLFLFKSDRKALAMINGGMVFTAVFLVFLYFKNGGTI